MTPNAKNSLEFTPQEYAYFRAEVFKRVRPWEKRSLFFDEFTVEDCRGYLRFRNMAAARHYQIWDVQIERTSERVRIHWSAPGSPKLIQFQIKFFFPALAFIATVFYVCTRDLPGFGIFPILICLVIATLLLAGIFAFSQYQREEGMRQLDALFSECTRDAKAQCVVAVKSA